MKPSGSLTSAVLYLAVVPFYRQECIDALQEAMGDRVTIFTGDRHCDPTVRTGIRSDQYVAVSNRFIAGRRLLLQTGHWGQVLRADVAILDLNPRSLTAWILTLARWALRRRTLLWGHLHPRAGADSRTNSLRQFLRRISNGTVLYGYDSVLLARAALPDQPVWVAPNSLYRKAQLGPAGSVDGRNLILYVGRLEPAKKVDQLVRAFAAAGLAGNSTRLCIVGTGSMADDLAALAETLGCADAVDFTGQVTDPRVLRDIYDRTILSVSPGYAGLSLTQSLGFGVPMLVSRHEPHAPEIELAGFGNVLFYDDQTELTEILQSINGFQQPEPSEVRRPVLDYYCAEDMAAGLQAACEGRMQNLVLATGWPLSSVDITEDAV
ncbi:glycosyltransferase family 4 protein [Nakamurella flava]|uniref:Glycosyltransferase family 4 protein n=1 Tax=Nakamurella flava TaxID=2576308 RepID=A0A4U6QBQ9_9ACTN|nr:glycosyltransferase family 4 protein [Nakamurella flava]TKV57352.1 glycosyltransferase family 4 protein [Nakamurella flava]